MKNLGLNNYRYLFRALIYHKPVMLVLFGIIGFVLPMFYAFIYGFPVPHIHDELSYLLAADTFAHGKLTNPTPQFWEHFESPHILLTPSYASKYPPLQGLFLAVGQVVFGHPMFGVWLSCGVAASALFWMLTGWTGRKWAILGTMLMIGFVGINGYWAQSYWGGMTAASGGALFFGGFRRLFRKLSVGTTLLMVLGGIILVNSRPFEGFITMCPALFVLFIWFLTNKKKSFTEKSLKFLLPGLFLTAVGMAMMFYYNFRVTGDFFNLPYAEHTRQYLPTPLFIFQPKNESANKGHPRLREFYESYSVPDSISSQALYAFDSLIISIPWFFLAMPLRVLFYLTVLLSIIRSRWLALMIGTILLTFAFMSLAMWSENYHYSASLTCCFYLLMTEGLRQIVVAGKRKKKGVDKFAPAVLLATVIVISLIYSQISPPDFLASQSDDSIVLSPQTTFNKPIKLETAGRVTYLKAEIEKAVEKNPDQYIAIVSYEKNYSTFYEIVYNKADIENAKIIWAYDLGEVKNKALLDYYKNRKVLLIKISASAFEITPLPELDKL